MTASCRCARRRDGADTAHKRCGQACGHAATKRVSRLAGQGPQNFGDFLSNTDDPRREARYERGDRSRIAHRTLRTAASTRRCLRPHRLWTKLRTLVRESGFTPYAARPAGLWRNYRQRQEPRRRASLRRWPVARGAQGQAKRRIAHTRVSPASGAACAMPLRAVFRREACSQARSRRSAYLRRRRNAAIASGRRWHGRCSPARGLIRRRATSATAPMPSRAAARLAPRPRARP